MPPVESMWQCAAAASPDATYSITEVVQPHSGRAGVAAAQYELAAVWRLLVRVVVVARGAYGYVDCRRRRQILLQRSRSRWTARAHLEEIPARIPVAAC
jgi:hypothetical protein